MPPKSISQWNLRPPIGLTTGSQLKKRDPERYNAIVRAVRLGIAPDTVMKVFETSRDLINAVCNTEKIDPASDQLIINKLAKAQNMCADAILSALEDGTLTGERAAVPLGIITDKLDQIMRKPTKIIETRNINLTKDALEGLISQATATKTIEAEVVEDKS